MTDLVFSRDKKEIGRVVGERPCQLESCMGWCLGVRWADGRLTWPCVKGSSCVIHKVGTSARLAYDRPLTTTFWVIQ